MTARRDPTSKAEPITALQPQAKRGRGRPARIEMPSLPVMEMTDQEKNLQAFFIAAYQQDYPDLSQTDLILLHLASIEYVKYLRVAAEELATGTVITMSRQHPAVNMRALLDQMGATRKQRSTQKSPTDSSIEDARKAFLEMSQD